jgi:HEPN domain-containing protein
MSDSDDARLWLCYARENLQVAQLALGARLLNPCLQNVQQAIEKSLKAMIVSRGQDARRTHSTVELAAQLRKIGLAPDLRDEENELIDSIFRPSRYPPDSALPNSMPDEAMCRDLVMVAERVVAWAERLLNAP